MSLEEGELVEELAQADWDDPLNRKELLAFLKRCNPRTRSTVIRAIEGRVSTDGVAFIKEHVEAMEPDNTIHTIDFVSARECDFGHLLDEKNRLVSRASCCGALTCAEEGCSLNCVRCGASLCRRHASIYADGEVYCASCKSHKWLQVGLRVTGKAAGLLWRGLKSF